jgi:cyclophilin family peptidyl-prolyl cis-trans isomerase/uncharacterized protein (UPF0212 family)
MAGSTADVKKPKSRSLQQLAGRMGANPSAHDDLEPPPPVSPQSSAFSSHSRAEQQQRLSGDQHPAAARVIPQGKTSSHVSLPGISAEKKQDMAALEFKFVLRECDMGSSRQLKIEDPDGKGILFTLPKNSLPGDTVVMSRADEKSAWKFKHLVRPDTEQPVEREELSMEQLQLDLKEQSVEVTLSTTKGDMAVTIVPKWAPKGAQRFLDMIDQRFYHQGVAVYRAVPDYIVQFGVVNGTPPFGPILDDPLIGVPIEQGSVVFAAAGPDSRKHTLCIFLNSFPQLSRRLSLTPIGMIRDTKSMAVVRSFFTGYGEVPQAGGQGPDPLVLEQKGNQYIRSDFPQCDFITGSCRGQTTPESPLGARRRQIATQETGGSPAEPRTAPVLKSSSQHAQDEHGTQHVASPKTNPQTTALEVKEDTKDEPTGLWSLRNPYGTRRQSESTIAGASTLKSETQKDNQITSDATASQLNARLDMLSDQILEHTKRLNGLTASDAEDLQFNARLDMMSDQILEHTKRLSGLTASGAIDMQLNARLDLLNDQIIDYTEKLDGLNTGGAIDSQLQARLDVLDDHILKHTVRLDCLSQQLETDVAAEELTLRMGRIAEQLDALQVEVKTSQGRAETSQTSLSHLTQNSLSKLKREMQEELVGLRMAVQGQSETGQSDLSSFKAGVQKDIRSITDAIDMQLNVRLDMLNDKMLEYTKILDDLTPQLEAEVQECKKTFRSANDAIDLQLNARIDMVNAKMLEYTKRLDDLTPKFEAEVQECKKTFKSAKDAIDLQLNARLDVLNAQTREHAKRLDGLTPQCEADHARLGALNGQTREHAKRLESLTLQLETDHVGVAEMSRQLNTFQDELNTLQGKVETVETPHTTFPSLKEEVVAQLRKRWPEPVVSQLWSPSCEDLAVQSTQRCSSTHSNSSTVESEVHKDIENASDATASQSNAKLDMLSDKMLENTKRLDNLMPQWEADRAAIAQAISETFNIGMDRLCGQLTNLNETSDRQEARIDKLADEVKLIYYQVLTHGQRISRLKAFEEQNN